MKSYGVYDGSMIITGTPEEVVTALWRNCKAHCTLDTVQQYMEWQRENLMKWNRITVDTSTYQGFLDSLAQCGVIVPMS